MHLHARDSVLVGHRVRAGMLGRHKWRSIWKVLLVWRYTLGGVWRWEAQGYLRNYLPHCYCYLWCLVRGSVSYGKFFGDLHRGFLFSEDPTVRAKSFFTTFLWYLFFFLSPFLLHLLPECFYCSPVLCQGALLHCGIFREQTHRDRIWDVTHDLPRKVHLIHQTKAFAVWGSCRVEPPLQAWPQSPGPFYGLPLISCTQKRNPSPSCIPVLSLNSWQNYCTVTWI